MMYAPIAVSSSASMADLYGRWVPDEWIARVHASMLKSPQMAVHPADEVPARYVGLELPGGAWVGTLG